MHPFLSGQRISALWQGVTRLLDLVRRRLGLRPASAAFGMFERVDTFRLSSGTVVHRLYLAPAYRTKLTASARKIPGLRPPRKSRAGSRYAKKSV